MWGKNVAFTFIRPQRYTKKFIDKNDCFSLCFFDNSFKKNLSYLGSVSGKKEDKISKSGLSPCFINNIPCFEEANMILICKKLYVQELEPTCFINPFNKLHSNINEYTQNDLNEKWYKDKDYHFMYISEITDIYGLK